MILVNLINMGSSPGAAEAPSECLEGDVGADAPPDPRRRHLPPRLCEGPAGVDRAARVLDDRRVKASPARVEGGPGDAEIRGEPDEDDVLEPAVAKVPREPRGGLAVGLAEGRVRVDVLPVALTQDELGVRDVELLVKLGAGRPLDAMVRPEHLSAVRKLGGLEGLPEIGRASCRERLCRWWL